MKTRFTTLDTFAAVADLQAYTGMRVQNVYDCDAKTYLIKLTKTDFKAVILLESANRLHATTFDWPKPSHPGGFTMKLRKHIRQKRLDCVRQVSGQMRSGATFLQLGIDRIVDMQFGGDVYACHVILEMYDRGNVILTDHEYNILYLLRWRTDKDTDVRFAVGQRYPVENARAMSTCALDEADVHKLITTAKGDEQLRKVLVSSTAYAAPLLEHVALLCANVNLNEKCASVADKPDQVANVCAMLQQAHDIFVMAKNDTHTVGYITYRLQERCMQPSTKDAQEPTDKADTFEEYLDFHSMLFNQVAAKGAQTPYKTFATFSQAVDEFFSARESQKLDVRAKQQEKSAMKKLQNIERDHEQRLKALDDTQTLCFRKAELIELNADLVERALTFMRAALAQGYSWDEIDALIKQSASGGQNLARRITKLDLKHGAFTILLDDAHLAEDDNTQITAGVECEIDITQNAFQNARAHHDTRRWAAVKEQKTIVASKKALKSTKIKTEAALKQVQIKSAVSRQRRVYWFEKFYWFISADNYLVLGGRDAQQNEQLVRRHLKAGDAYVHADMRGCASVVVKNRSVRADAMDIPARTMHAAGVMAVVYSPAWDAKVVPNVWWVRHDQVTRTAPSGEYLTTGSFMIRGQKQFLPPAQLVMGFAFLFKLDDESVPAHRFDRVHSVTQSENGGTDSDNVEHTTEGETEEIVLSSSDDEAAVEDTIIDENESKIEDDEFPDVSIQLHQSARISSTTDGVDGTGECTLIQIGPQFTPQEYREKSRQKKTALMAISTKKSGAPLKTVAQAHAELKATEAEAKNLAGQPNNRRQKHKAKKIAQKYHDQDDEERQLRMEILQAPTKKSSKKQQVGMPSSMGTQRPAVTQSVENVQSIDASVKAVPIPTTSNAKHAASDVDDEEEEEKAASEDEAAADEAAMADDVELDMLLTSLTGRPCADDVLLFAVPVCAPYATLHDYKYKVKVTPGTGKRGKATKMAVQIFLKDRTGTERERDLLKAAGQQQDLGRNVPSKVKMQAPTLLKIKTEQMNKTKAEHKIRDAHH